jgi:DNA segregation ATPase FtsK/SpoIIIE-like protein
MRYVGGKYDEFDDEDDDNQDDDDQLRYVDDDDEDESSSRAQSRANPFASSGSGGSGGSSFGGNRPAGSGLPGSSGSSGLAGKPPGVTGGGARPATPPASSSAPGGGSAGSSFGRPASGSFGGGSPPGGSSSGGSAPGARPSPFGGGSGAPGAGSGSSPSGGSAPGARPSPFGGGSSAPGAGSGSAPSSQSAPGARPSPFGGGSSAPGAGSGSAPSSQSAPGARPFGGGSSSAPPASKPAEPKKDDGEKKGGLLGGLGNRFGGGGDDKKAAPPKSPGAEGDKKGGLLGGGLGGLTSRFGGGGDDKKPAPPKSPGAEGDKKGGLLGGLTNRFGGGGDDKKPAAASAPGASSSPFGKPASGTPGSSGSVGGFGGGAKPGTPPASGAKDSGGGLLGGRLPFGRAGGNTAPGSSPAKPAGAKSAGGGFSLGRFLPFLNRDAADSKTDKKARPAKAPRVQTEGMSLDTKLDLLGVGLVLSSIVLILSRLSSTRGSITETVNTFFVTLFGWGSIAIPVAMLAVGIWLIARHFGEEAPVVPGSRIIGIVITYAGLLVALQYIDTFSYVDQFGNPTSLDSLRNVWLPITIGRGSGGGTVGAELYYFLVSNLTEIGAFVGMVGILIIGLMFTLQISAAELAMIVIGSVRTFQDTVQQRSQVRAQKRAASLELLAEQARAAEVIVTKPAEPALPAAAAVAALPPAPMNALPAPEPERKININVAGKTLSDGQPATANGVPLFNGAPAQIPANPATPQAGGSRFKLPSLGRKDSAPAAAPVAAATTAPASGDSKLGLGTAVAAAATGGVLGGVRGLFNRGEKTDKPEEKPAAAPTMASTAPVVPATMPSTPPVPAASSAAPTFARPAPAINAPASAPTAPSFTRPAEEAPARLGDLIKPPAPASASTSSAPPASPAFGGAARPAAPLSPVNPAPTSTTPGADKPSSGSVLGGLSGGASSAAPVRPSPFSPPSSSPTLGGLGSKPAAPFGSSPSKRPEDVFDDELDEEDDELFDDMLDGAKELETDEDDDLDLKPATPKGSFSPTSTSAASGSTAGDRTNRLNEIRSGGSTPPAASSAGSPARPVPFGGGSAPSSSPFGRPATPVSGSPFGNPAAASNVPSANDDADDEPPFKVDDKTTFAGKPISAPAASASPAAPGEKKPEAAPAFWKTSPTGVPAAPAPPTNGGASQSFGPPTTPPVAPMAPREGGTIAPNRGVGMTAPTNAPRKPKDWRLPSIAQVLMPGSEGDFDREALLRRARIIEDTLQSFGAPGKVVEVNTGPVITQFGVEPDYLTTRGGKKNRVKVSAIAQLDKDLQLALGARSIRVEAPVPGKGYVGIEVPNDQASLVSLRDIMEADAFKKVKSPLAIALGQAVDGRPVAADLASMPHLLIAGTTGSGKSVCVNAIIASIIATNTPDRVKFIMVDPKRVELTGYNGIPHLVAPVVVELERIVGVLKWVTREMDDRYKRFSQAGARNIEDFNKHLGPDAEPMHYIVVIIDELADLMMMAPDETERVITRIAALARATGIHLVIATQRPSVDVVTGLIKANFPARIAFAVAGGVDSRVILDQPGAERLLGRGDMLYMSGDAPAPLRLQGVYVSDNEITNLTRFWKAQVSPDDVPARPISALVVDNSVAEPSPASLNNGNSQQAFWDSSASSTTVTGTGAEDENPDQDDVLYEEAVEMVRRLNKASVSLLQRRLRIGYTRAARLIDRMEAEGIVGPAVEGAKPREVLK